MKERKGDIETETERERETETETYINTPSPPLPPPQPEFLGLRYMSKKPYPKVRWVELDRPLKKQLDKYAQSPTLALAVLYYIHDVALLQDDVTRCVRMCV